jgi:hypothetical protein
MERRSIAGILQDSREQLLPRNNAAPDGAESDGHRSICFWCLCGAESGGYIMIERTIDDDYKTDPDPQPENDKAAEIDEALGK